jgi:glycosyltransferase involved in cell wall biosynthesis
VWDAHEFLPGVDPWRNNVRWLPAHCAYEREYVPYADAAITVSIQLAELLQKQHKLAELPAVVLNAPSADQPADTDRADLRELCGIGPSVPLLVYSGVTAGKRGLGVVVEALPKLPGVHLAIVANQPAGAYARQLLARAGGLDVLDRLHILPYVPYDQVVAFLAAADVGVIPIQHWPNHEIALITKFFEYAQARLPMVISDVRVMAETTRSLGQGEVFRADDVDDFVRAVTAVLADPCRYRAAYDRPGLLEAWAWEAQAEILDGVYSRLLPGRHPPTAAAGGATSPRMPRQASVRTTQQPRIGEERLAV